MMYSGQESGEKSAQIRRPARENVLIGEYLFHKGRPSRERGFLRLLVHGPMVTWHQ